MQSAFLCVFMKTVKKISKHKKIEDTLFYDICAVEKIECAQRDLMGKITCMQRPGGWVSPK